MQQKKQKKGRRGCKSWPEPKCLLVQLLGLIFLFTAAYVSSVENFRCLYCKNHFMSSVFSWFHVSFSQRRVFIWHPAPISQKLICQISQNAHPHWSTRCDTTNAKLRNREIWLWLYWFDFTEIKNTNKNVLWKYFWAFLQIGLIVCRLNLHKMLTLDKKKQGHDCDFAFNENNFMFFIFCLVCRCSRDSLDVCWDDSPPTCDELLLMRRHKDIWKSF